MNRLLAQLAFLKHTHSLLGKNVKWVSNDVEMWSESRRVVEIVQHTHKNKVTFYATFTETKSGIPVDELIKVK